MRRYLEIYTSGIIIGLSSLLRVVFLKYYFGDNILVNMHLYRLIYDSLACLVYSYLSGLMYEKELNGVGIKTFSLLLMLPIIGVSLIHKDLTYVLIGLILILQLYIEYAIGVIMRNMIKCNFIILYTIYLILNTLSLVVVYCVNSGSSVIWYTSILVVEVAYSIYIATRYNISILSFYKYNGWNVKSEIKIILSYLMRKPSTLISYNTKNIIELIIIPNIAVGVAADYIFVQRVHKLLREGANRLRSEERHRLVESKTFKDFKLTLMYHISVAIAVLCCFTFIKERELVVPLVINTIVGTGFVYYFWIRSELILITHGLSKILLPLAVLDSLSRILIAYLYPTLIGTLHATTFGVLLSTIVLLYFKRKITREESGY